MPRQTEELVHDFRNLLYGIHGCAELALAETPSGSPVAEMIREIVAASVQGATLCKQMLLRTCSSHLQEECVDLNAIIRNLMPMLKTYLPRIGIIESFLDEELPMLAMPDMGTRQILINLVTNASQALGDRPGKVALRTGWMELDSRHLRSETWIGTAKVGHYAYLEVADTGLGMDATTCRKVFDPYFTTKPTGHGLGMSSVLRIISENGGAIRINSQIGIGTTILAIFPCNQSFEAIGESRVSNALETTRLSSKVSGKRAVSV